MQTLVLLSRAWFLAPLLQSPPAEQWFWIETYAYWSSGGVGASGGPRGSWPAGRDSSRSAVFGWNRTAALGSPLWPGEVAVSDILDRRQGGPEQDRNWHRLRGRQKPNGKQCPEAGSLNPQGDISFHCQVLHPLALCSFSICETTCNFLFSSWKIFYFILIRIILINYLFREL